MDGLLGKNTITTSFYFLLAVGAVTCITHGTCQRGTNAQQKRDEDSHLQLRIPIYLVSDCPGDSFCDTVRASEL